VKHKQASSTIPSLIEKDGTESGNGKKLKKTKTMDETGIDGHSDESSSNDSSKSITMKFY